LIYQLISTSYVYDELDRRTKVTNALNQITKTSYDAVGNLLAIEDVVGNVTSYTYDANDRLLVETNALGKTRSHAYDAVGKETSRIDRNGGLPMATKKLAT
jgi:YD repeat-containing protein